jgi:hypothetical protein
MTKNIRMLPLLFAGVLVMQAWPVFAATNPAKMQNMINLLDRLDREDFLENLEKANNCTVDRNFGCSDKQLEAAKKLINGSDDKKLWESAMAFRADEKKRADEEQRQRELAEQRIRDEERRAEERAERQRRAEEEQERREQAAREKETNKQALLALVGAAAIAKGTSGKNYTDAQRSQMVDSWTKDRMNAANGSQTNNFSETADRVKSEMKAKSEMQSRQAEIERQRQADQMRQQIAQRRAEDARQESLAQTRQAQRQGTADASRYQPQTVAMANTQAEQKRSDQLAQQEQTRQQKEQLRQQQEQLQQQEARRKEQLAIQERQQEELLRKQRAKEKAEQDAQAKLEREKREAEQKAEQIKKDGCFVPVRHPQNCLVVESTRWNKDNFKFVLRNHCDGRLYVSMCNLQKDGNASCGADGVRQGGTISWDTYNATGNYAYKFTGSRKWDADWVCGNADRDPEFHAQDLKRDLGAK